MRNFRIKLPESRFYKKLLVCWMMAHDWERWVILRNSRQLYQIFEIQIEKYETGLFQRSLAREVAEVCCMVRNPKHRLYTELSSSE